MLGVSRMSVFLTLSVVLTLLDGWVIEKNLLLIKAKIKEFLFYNSPNCVKSVQIRSFFWSAFSHIRTEYGEIQSTFPYSVRMKENKDQKKLRIWALFTQCLVQTLTSTKMQRCIQNPSNT